MTLKEFDIGQMVFILNIHEGRNREPKIREARVKAVGRKYVTIDNGNRYEQREKFRNGLVQNIDFGEITFLCSSVTEANNYIKQSKLSTWISNIPLIKSRNYTLEQLQKVKEILGD